MENTTPGTRPPEIDGRFVNLDGTTPDKNGLAVLRWLVCNRLGDELRQGSAAFLDLFRREKSWRPPFRPNEAAALDPSQPHLTWIGHSTFLLRIGGHWLLTDPVFGHPAATMWRHVPPGLPPDRLPQIDLVTLSHDHYDHLDIPSLAALKGEPKIVGPLQMGRYLPRFPNRVGSPPAPPAGTSGPTAHPARPALRAPSSPAAHHRGREGEAEREGASVASGCGREGAGPEVPEGGSERGGDGGWGAEGRSEPSQGSPIVELDWWQCHERPGLRITLTPAHHWGMRGITTRNRTLWGGFIFQGDGLTIYFAGDSALQPPVFKAIHERFPRIDIAILPIGAYAPRWFMQAQHMDPEEAVTAYQMLGARRFVAMHWGTFFLSSEPTREPLDRLKACWTERGYRTDELWIMDVGETRRLSAEKT